MLINIDFSHIAKPMTSRIYKNSCDVKILRMYYWDLLLAAYQL